MNYQAIGEYTVKKNEAERLAGHRDSCLWHLRGQVTRTVKSGGVVVILGAA